jgi:hypothetical protein
MDAGNANVALPAVANGIGNFSQRDWQVQDANADSKHIDTVHDLRLAFKGLRFHEPVCKMPFGSEHFLQVPGSQRVHRKS